MLEREGFDGTMKDKKIIYWRDLEKGRLIGRDQM